MIIIYNHKKKNAKGLDRDSLSFFSLKIIARPKEVGGFEDW